MNMTRARLADGREIFYYDDNPGTTRKIEDKRELPARPPTGNMRYDVLRNEWVSFAAHRQTRTFLPKTSECPLCPTTDEFETEVPSNSYDVVVFENRFPSFKGSHHPMTAEPLESSGMIRPAFGRCEVTSYTPNHDDTFADLPVKRFRTVINAWAHRTKTLSEEEGIEQIFPFENHGRAIGVTLDHPHGQIYAYPYVTPTTKLMLDTAKEYIKKHGNHPMEDVLAREHREEERILQQGKYFTSFVPFAARMPLEIHIVPHTQYADLSELADEERDELASMYKAVLEMIEGLYHDETAYIAAWHQAPVRQDREYGWLHLEITSPRRSEDKLKYLAGSEAAMGAFIADVLPEETAQRLKEARMTPHAVKKNREHSAERTTQYFEEAYGTKPDGIWAAPGRVNLIGEHTDYNEGFVFPFALDKTTHCAVKLTQGNTIEVASVFENNDVKTETISTDLDKDKISDWAAYPLGVLWAFKTAGYDIPAMEIMITSNVPIGAGLSSSAAIECAVALAINDLLDLNIPKKQLAAYCRQAENDVVGAPTGIMDQSASLLGEKDHALFLDCRSLDTDLVPLNLGKADASILVIDTHVSHALADGEGYAARKASCDKAAELLDVPTLRDVTQETLENVPDDMDLETAKRMRHVVTENDRVLQAAKALKNGTIEDIGSLLDASHESMRDDFEISCPELDLAVATAQKNGAIGARMTGGGFGGSAIAVVKNEDIETIKEAIYEAFLNAGYNTPSIFTVSAGSGATRIQ
ncbi:MAG: galactokinase [Micrococcaceae bacterium]